jgi:CRP/FNR family transcriptional regulator, cyclic AMP receptor protein
MPRTEASGSLQPGIVLMSHDVGDVAPLVHPWDLFPTTHFPKTRNFKRGEVMFHQGDPVRSFYLVQDGIAKEMIESENGEEYITALATRRNPIILGLQGLDHGPYGTTAEAVTPVVAQQIPRRDVESVIKGNSEYILALMRHLTQSVRSRTLKIADMVFLDLQARLAINLLDGADQLADYAQNTEDLPEFSHLTQEDLGAMIGSTRASVNKLIGYWEEKNYVRRVERRIVVRNPDAIRNVGANEAVLEPFPEVSYQQETEVSQRKSA